MASRFAVCIHRNPIRVGGLHIVVRCMRIRSSDYDHVQFSATGHQFTERVPIAEPGTAMMEWNFRRVVGDTTASTEADCIRPSAFEVIEPESKIKGPRIILDQRELRPTHWLIDPTRSEERRVGK